MRIFAAVLSLFSLFLSGCDRDNGPGSVISLRELKRLIGEDKELLIIDVRTPAEYESGHIPGAVSVPLQGIEAAISAVVPDKASYFIIYCRTGRRSKAAAGILKGMGYSNFSNYAGSMKEWVADGNPVEK